MGSGGAARSTIVQITYRRIKPGTVFFPFGIRRTEFKAPIAYNRTLSFQRCDMDFRLRDGDSRVAAGGTFRLNGWMGNQHRQHR
jgi:hypothetical protein